MYQHCLIVCGIAEQLHGRAGLDSDLGLVGQAACCTTSGCTGCTTRRDELDHANYIRHGLLGHELLRTAGFPEAICRFASCHTGMGLSKDDVIGQRLPLPPADYLAETGEEKLVMYADKFHSKTTPPALLTACAYAVSVRRFGEDKVAGFESMRAAFGEPDLGPFATPTGSGCSTAADRGDDAGHRKVPALRGDPQGTGPRWPVHPERSRLTVPPHQVLRVRQKWAG